MTITEQLAAALRPFLASQAARLSATVEDYRIAREALAAFDAAQQDTARAPAGGHTAEPWACDDGEFITARPGLFGPMQVACIDTSPADARRIVACVNACAGIPTERLEKLGLGVFEHCVAGWYGENL